MAKFKDFTQEEKDLLKRKGMPWRLWEALFRAPSSLIIKNVISGEVRLIEKDHIPS